MRVSMYHTSTNTWAATSLLGFVHPTSNKWLQLCHPISGVLPLINLTVEYIYNIYIYTYTINYICVYMCNIYIYIYIYVIYYRAYNGLYMDNPGIHSTAWPLAASCRVRQDASSRSPLPYSRPPSWPWARPQKPWDYWEISGKPWLFPCEKWGIFGYHEILYIYIYIPINLRNLGW